jgi:hypothetical protein
MSIQNWEHFFKPEARSSGRTLFSQGKVSIAQPSDTEVVVYVRTSPPIKASLKVESVASDTVYVDCNCPAGKKNQFCKHVWAGLLATEEKSPDFFEAKTEIEKKEFSSKSEAIAKPTAQSQAWQEKQTALKEQQKTYRKVQYQKQKQRLLKSKKNREDEPAASIFPEEVESALNFFSENGFDLRDSLNVEQVSTAKKKLSRVFHPDRGGNHAEILELNKWADILMEYAAE